MLHNRKNAKLSAEAAYRIRQDYATGHWTQAALAVREQVSLNTIRNVLQGVTWQAVPMPKSEEEESYEVQQMSERLKRMIKTDMPDDTAIVSSIAERMAPPVDPLDEILKRRSRGVSIAQAQSAASPHPTESGAEDSTSSDNGEASGGGAPDAGAEDLPAPGEPPSGTES